MTQPSPEVLRGITTSYLFLRRSIGVIGLALPFVLFGYHSIQAGKVLLRGSISSYYYTEMRDVFVGSLFAIGVFLFCYRFRRLDNVLSNLAGVMAVGVALFPATPADPSHTEVIVGRVHGVLAAILFGLLALFCFVSFPKVDNAAGRVTAHKIARNRIYRTCGVLIVLSMLVVLAIQLLPVPRSFVDTYRPLFFAESVAIIAFGFSWFVKGGTILRD
jgi:hypothetical protein